jgi:hypothetical protein
MNVQRASGSCGGRQHEFNNGQMLPRQTRQPQPPTQQQHQIQPQKKEEEAASLRFGNAPGPIVGLLLISVVGVARIESPGVTPPGLFHWRPGKTMPVFGNSFPFWFHGTFLFGRGSVLIPKPLS